MPEDEDRLYIELEKILQTIKGSLVNFLTCEHSSHNSEAKYYPNRKENLKNLFLILEKKDQALK
jgi:hypothetical protein